MKKRKKKEKEDWVFNVQKMMTMWLNAILAVQFEKKKKISNFSTC